MSAHAVACRRHDLTDFLAVLFDVLEPLFAFLLLDSRRPLRTVPTSAVTPPLPASEPVADVPQVPAEPVADVPVIVDAVKGATSDTRSACRFGGDDGPAGPFAATPYFIASSVVPAKMEAERVSEGSDIGRERVTGIDRGETVPLFAKINGRFRPAPAGFAGEVYERVVSAGGRTTYREVV